VIDWVSKKLVNTRLGNLFNGTCHIGSIEFINILFPLITYPYLIRVLGVEIYGSLIFFQAVVGYIVIVVNYGFNVTAIRDTAKLGEDINRLSEMLSSVLIVKTLIFIACAPLYVLAVYKVPVLYANKELAFFTLYLCLQEVLVPIWFFQGIQKYGILIKITLLSKLMFVVLIFLFVTEPDDGLLYMQINFFLALVMGLFTLWSLRNDGLYLCWVGQRKIAYLLKDGVSFFLSRAASVFGEKTISILIGQMIGMSELAYFDFATKLANLGKLPASVFNRVLFPKVSAHYDSALVLEAIKLVVYCSLMIMLLLIGFAEEITWLLAGEKMKEAYWGIVILSFTIPLNSVSYQLGNCVLVLNNKERYFNFSTVYFVTINLTGLVCLWFFDLFSLINVCLVLVLSSCYDVAYRYAYSKEILLKEKY